MVKIERELPVIFSHGSEKCCICLNVTPFWTKIEGRDDLNQVPLCAHCAPNTEPEDVPPTRLAWAQRQNRVNYPKWNPWKP